MTFLPIDGEFSLETETKHLDIFMAIFYCHDVFTMFYKSVNND